MRIAHLMERYADRPMDLADATLVALAEERNSKRILTLDRDFSIYRLHGRARSKRFLSRSDLKVHRAL